jgi:hypothetical protein
MSLGPLWSNNGQTLVRLRCPLSANSGHGASLDHLVGAVRARCYFFAHNLSSAANAAPMSLLLPS